MRNPWLILIAGVVGALATLPGQTGGVSPFIDFLMESLQLSRNNLSLAYLIGTVVSAMSMPRAGRIYDRYGSKLVALLSGGALGLSLLAISMADRVVTVLVVVLPFLTVTLVGTGVMALGFFLLRFFGQGILSMASRNMVMKWFDYQRGLGNAVLAPLTALGASYAPRVFDSMINAMGWRGAWRATGLFLMTVFVLFAWLFFRDPTRSDRERARTHRSVRFPLPRSIRRTLRARAECEPARPEHDYTLEEARKTPAYWLFCIIPGFGSLVGTGFTFHVVSVFAAGGMSRATALAVFFPATVFAIVVQLFSNLISDYVRLRYFAAIQMIGIFLLMAGVYSLGPGLPYGALVTGLGLNAAMSAINGVIVWPRFFGLKHLGAISGTGFVWMVGGSAFGPYAFSLAQQLGGDYKLAAMIFGLMAAALFFAAFKAENPNRTSVENGQTGC